MKTASVSFAVLILALTAWAQQQPVNINFNLVQVNHYHGQDSVLAGTTTPGQRVVIDLRNPMAAMALKMSSDRKIDVSSALVNVTTYNAASGTTMTGGLSWESSKVIYSPAGEDSFLVTASRTGCPGTEVRPSVSVAFATSAGWSSPPIRFGPLYSTTVCALGRGYQLEVSAQGDEPPKVSLLSQHTEIGKR